MGYRTQPEDLAVRLRLGIWGSAEYILYRGGLLESLYAWFGVDAFAWGQTIEPMHPASLLCASPLLRTKTM